MYAVRSKLADAREDERGFSRGAREPGWLMLWQFVIRGESGLALALAIIMIVLINCTNL